MKYKSIMAIALSAGMLACGSGKEKTEDTNEAPLIGKSAIKITDGVMTPEALYSFGRVSDVQVSPDNAKVLYGVTYVSVEQNKTNRELFTMNVDGTDNKQITKTPKSENNAVWVKNGSKVAFLSSESGSSQIWEMNVDGTDRIQISDVNGGINGFTYSPDGKKVLYIKNVKYGERAVDKYPDLPKASGRIIDDLMYKHWDAWVEEVPHPFIADFDGEKLVNDLDLLEGEPCESPMLPSGGIEQLAWSPDSKTVAYTCRKKKGLEYALSTNSDIYFYNLDTKETRNITEGMMGYDINPTFSSDGKYVAWQSMERDGYESDKNRLFVMDLSSGEKIYVTENFDYNTDFAVWSKDNQSMYIVSCVEAKTQIFQAYIHTKEIKALTKGVHDYESFAIAGDKLIALRHSMSQPNEIYSVSTSTGEAAQITHENKEILDQITMGKVEERWIATTDGKKMLTWVVYPPNFDANKKYPTLLYCQGGPQSTVSQFWSYRWNLQMMAANGYIIVAPNRRGLPSFGKEWNEQISGDYGGQNMKDYLSAIDELAKEPFVDKDHLGCTGASYGGFSAYWLAGNHNERFKAFLAHAGIFNLEAQYLETEEMWFANWDLGGSFWDRSNSIAQRSYANSPHRFVEKWDTPIMITHGEFDFRILASQGMMAFNAAKLRGIPTRMLIFPDESHWIAQPQNGILFQREFFRWFDQWLKK
ncbi:dipeptidyl aminopeptidase/acylaminoacyl peptidase [Dysgonomonas alginatilytica]|uniref:Dipeptidyl-peptidase 5 n=1 Tax=Dysgonomonas alginatilytica TaxID=1605892 RepID=A0A2V3PSP3_9BACT|nr:S9 family peptidase [Dysgonomonas alginatilytica]PXV66809.1 dipeptidyl aminopeptidase/acylaminoacyl peptidase [Dysgonomonas alginatilytica]